MQVILQHCTTTPRAYKACGTPHMSYTVLSLAVERAGIIKYATIPDVACTNRCTSNPVGNDSMRIARSLQATPMRHF